MHKFNFDPLNDHLKGFDFELKFHHDEFNGNGENGEVGEIQRALGATASNPTVEVDPLDQLLEADFTNQGAPGDE